MCRWNYLKLGGIVAASLAVRVIRQRRSLYQNHLKSLSSCATPPVLKKKPQMVPFGVVEGSDQNRGANPMSPTLYLSDPYFYVRDDSRENAEVLAHLHRENDYCNHMTKHLTEQHQQQLYEELLSHVQETDEAYPYPHQNYLYYTRTVKGSSYLFHCRKPKDTSSQNQETILLDENQLAKGLKHCDVGDVSISPDHTLLAYSVDTTGYETYVTHFKNVATDTQLTDKIENMAGSIEWGKDNSEVFYSKFDDVHRTNSVWRHRMGTESKTEDQCLFQDDDEMFDVMFQKTRSGKFLVIHSRSSETAEVHVLDLFTPNAKVQCVEKRKFGVIYDIDHQGDKFYIVTNKDNAINFKLMETNVNTPSADHWKDTFQYDKNIKINSVDCFANHFVISGRQNGLRQLWIVTPDKDGKLMKSLINFDEPIYKVNSSINMEYSTTKYRLSYSSLTVPPTTYDYDIKTKGKEFLKEKACPNYDRTLYQSERLEAKATDGTIIPMSMIYRKDLRNAKGPQPLHLYGYGSYEHSIDPSFQSTILPLLDRGVIYVIAHIRGGGEMGRTWYEDAKYLKKKNTFTDFINCAEHLIDCGITSNKMLTCEGRSAGGLLIGAVLNMRPDLFTAAIAGVPFVDVMCTMSDATIPLTTGEWEEWGNPNEKKYFEYMLSYSPIENVKAQDYPNILVTSGLYDPRVAYWEPTKWVAKLRDHKTDKNTVLLKMDMTSGHFSASDRYHYLKEKAFDTAYLLDQLGCLNKEN